VVFVFCLLYAHCTSDAYTATYPTVLTIVHLDGTSILSLYTSDLKGVYNRLIHFWPNQHLAICDTIAQERNRIKHCLNRLYFHIVQSLVYDRALFLILAECAKLHKAKEQHAVLPACRCTIKASMGLPCFHTVAERLKKPGLRYILPEDIHPF
jgi:hypothetical protein